MNIFKKIIIFNKINKALKEAKKLIDHNRQLTEDAKTIIANLKTNMEALIVLLPSLRAVYEDFKEILK